MTLQEFIKLPENVGYLEDRFLKINNGLGVLGSVTGTGLTPRLFSHYGNIVSENYEYINGYIRAAYVYGHLSKEECSSLSKELLDFVRL